MARSRLFLAPRQETVRIRLAGVRNSLVALSCVAGRVETHRVADRRPPDDWSPCMSDLGFVILVVAFFAVASLIVKGVERL